jgi:hypothetical protein
MKICIQALLLRLFLLGMTCLLWVSLVMAQDNTATVADEGVSFAPYLIVLGTGIVVIAGLGFAMNSRDAVESEDNR